ncbi:hypothetical protein EJ08DRAFT_241750 [Tothia fuscella]|uniref:F-box domain-containing protein n=1 Tax=Tothia fuscella TaxID=1048955 RepID=A0A9P4NRJ5_9PEZI|nr:hypothetical protein EJ08DRAFT_241750 [Tothia fuscella]
MVKFLELPAEIRLRIYELVLAVEKSVQLESANHKAITPLFKVFFVSRQFYEEAYRVFYAVNTFRIFSIEARFFQAKYPLLFQFKPKQRATLTTVELRLGHGWASPPRKWTITKRLGLKDCQAVKTLKIFIELDPTQSVITLQWMHHRTLYTDFSRDLVGKVYEAIPSIAEVEFDGYPSVDRDGDLMSALLAQARTAKKRIRYGPLHGWSEAEEKVAQPNQIVAQVKEQSLVNGMAALWPSVQAYWHSSGRGQLRI